MPERTDEREAVDADADLDELLSDSEYTTGRSGPDADVDVEAGLDDSIGDLGVDDAATDVGPDDGLADVPLDAENGGRTSGRSTGLLSGFRDPVSTLLPSVGLSDVFSPRSFGAVLGSTVVAMLAFSFFLPFGGVGGLLGVFTTAFLGGVIGSRSRYLEFSLAGAGTAAVALLLGQAITVLAFEFGAELAAIGAGGGAIAALVGHYLGRDVRDGFTREV